jgi:subtilisin-like proprotein convertase family protein
MNFHQLTRRAACASVIAALVASASQAQTIGCTTGGAAGTIPTSGTGGGGIFPTAFPPSETAMTLAVPTLPPGATVVTEVKFNGFFHTYAGDLQLVLTAPNGSRHNLVVLASGFCDYGGDYIIVNECTTGTPFGACGGLVTPGTYDQYTVGWPAGTQGVDNTPLSAIGAATGTWTLTVYDWAGADVGSMTSWDICFGTPPVPAPPASVPNLVSPADQALFCANSTDLVWDAVTCATSYDVDVNGSVTTGVVTTSLSLTNLAPGVYSWRVRAVNSASTTAYSTARTFTIGTVNPWTCVTGGAGGSFPSSGVDGTWPLVLPTGELSSTLAVTIPAGATRIKAVRLNGFNHTWSGDCQIVLTSPAGVNYNIFQEVDGIFAGGCAEDFAGDYSFADPVTGTDECGAPAIAFSCTAVGVLTPGVYGQYYGLWNSGDAGIVNVNLDSIPLASGNWTLKIYDWYVPADNGTLVSWDLCFDAGVGTPSVYCTAGTTTNGCNASITGTAQPSASLASPCVINVANVEGQKQGLVFYGVNNAGFSPLAWSPGSTSFLCVKSPTQRTGTQTSGGTTSTCTGAFTLDWNAYQAANPSALGNPFLSGAKVYAQAWFRDPPAPKTTNLSDALEMTVQP